VPAGLRSTLDRPDDSNLPQVHLIYMIPANGTDRGLDTNGSIRTAVESISNWFTQESGGLKLRWDTYGGDLDITFHRLSASEQLITAFGAFVRDLLEASLRSEGLIRPNKQYIAISDGGSTYACGGGAWPPVLEGVVSALYLNGTPPGATPCNSNTLGASATSPQYFEFAMIHELFHSFGLTAVCSPNHHLSGHVSDATNDLMWSGNAPWLFPAKLDIGRDDYFRHGIEGCRDLASVGYIDPLPDNYWLP